MKTFKIIGFGLILLFAGTISSCNKIDQKIEDKTVSKTMNAIKVAPGFTWETTRSIEVRLTAVKSGVVYINPTSGDYSYNKGYLAAGLTYTAKISIPAFVKEVMLAFNGQKIIVPFTGTSLVYNFK